MKKLFTIWAVMLSVLFAVGCTENSQTDQPNNGNNTENPGDNNGGNNDDENNGTTDEPTKPVISIKEVEVQADSFTFEVTTNVPGVLGYTVVAEGFSAPKMDEWFAANSKEIEGTENITISNLNDNTNYTLYAILRASKDGNLSAPKNWKFTTLDDGVANPITIDNVGYEEATFTISLPGKIIFQCIDKAYLTHNQITPEEYISEPGIGIITNGPLTVEWVNGGQYGPYEMRMRAGSEYYVIAAQCDNASTPNIIGEIYLKSFSTPHKPTTTAGVTTEITNVDSTSVTIKTTPDSDVAQYYVYVDSASQLHMIMDDYDFDIFLSTVLKQVVTYGNGWTLTAANEATWDNLTPNFEYSIALIVEDKKGAKNASLIDFTTGDQSMLPPTINLSISEADTDPHSNLVLNIKADNAASGKVVFRSTVEVNERRYDYSDDYIANNFGTTLKADQIEAINSPEGLSLTMPDLWPEVEYTAMVLLFNKEKVSTLKTTTYNTPAQAPAPRVESDLFTSLLGEWTMTYTLVQENGVQATVSEVVTIAQGVDSKTETDYRNQNRLVILGFPFEVNAQGGYSKMPVYTPAQLLEMLPKYYAKGQNLVYRDYGPKIFLEIGQGDTLSVPTSRGQYLYNWSDDGFLNFFGCDYNNQFTAPATFPVTLSADGNTLTIGAHHAGEEFGYGIYRPAVFLNEQKLEACATSDIVLTRK